MLNFIKREVLIRLKNNFTNISQDKVLTSLAKSSGLYALAKILNILFGFISFGLLARNFTPDEFGKLDFLLTAIIFLVNTSIFGQDQAIGRLINDPIEKDQSNKIANHGFLIQIIYSLFLTLLIYSIFYFITPPNNLIFSSYSNLTFSLFLIQVPFLVILYAGLGLLQWSNSRRYYAFLSVISYFIPTIFLFSILNNRSLSITQVLILYLISKVVVSIITIIFCYKKSFFKNLFLIDVKLLRKLAIFAIPLGLVVTLETFAPLIQRILIKSALSDYDLGVFALAYKISSIITVLGSAFSSAWGPIYLNAYKDIRSKNTFILIFKIVILISSISIMILSIFSSDIVNLLGSKEYAAANNLILPIAFGLSIEIINDITGIGFFISKKNYYFTLSYILFIISFTVIFMFLSPLYGYLSIGVSILLSYLIKNLFITILSNRFYKVNWPYKAAILSLFASFLISFFSNLYYPYLLLIHKIFLFSIGLFITLFIFFGYLTKSELQIFMQTSKSLRQSIKKFH